MSLSRKDSGCGCTDTDIRLPQIPVLMPTLGWGRTRADKLSAQLLSWLAGLLGLLNLLNLLICDSTRSSSAASPVNRQPPTTYPTNHTTALTFSPNKYTIRRPSIHYIY